MKLINLTIMNMLGCIQKDKRSYSEIRKLIGLNKYNTASYLKELVRMKLSTRMITKGYPVRVYYQATEEGRIIFMHMAEIYRLTKNYEVV